MTQGGLATRPDLLVIGGGPVGLVTALEAAMAGLSVTVVERRSAPIDKACGEGVMPSALERLTALGVDVVGQDFRGITYVDGGHRVSADFPGGPGRGVRRVTLHQSLSEAARAAGVRMLPGEASLIAVRPTHVAVNVDGHQVNASYVAAADGLHSQVRADLGLTAPATRRRRYGLRQHWTVEPWSDHVEVHWAAHAELYVTPVDDHTVGVAVLTSVRGRTYGDWLAEFPDVAKRIAAAPPASSVLGAGPLEQRARRRTAGRVLLVGDAAGYVDALTGEGLVVGVAGARALAAAVHADDPASYDRAWRQATWTSSLMTGALVRATAVPSVRRRLVPAASRLPRVFSKAVGALA